MPFGLSAYGDSTPTFSPELGTGQLWPEMTGFELTWTIDIAGADTDAGTTATLIATGTDKFVLTAGTRVTELAAPFGGTGLDDGEYYMDAFHMESLLPYQISVLFVSDQKTAIYTEDGDTYNVNGAAYIYFEGDSYTWNPMEYTKPQDGAKSLVDFDASVAVVSGPSTSLQSAMEYQASTSYGAPDYFAVNWSHAFNVDNNWPDGFEWSRTVSFDDGDGITVDGDITFALKITF